MNTTLIAMVLSMVGAAERKDGAIVVRVGDEAGRAMRGWSVDIIGARKRNRVVRWYPMATVDGTEFEIGDLPADDYTLTVGASGYAFAYARVSLGDGEHRSVDVKLGGEGVVLTGSVHHRRDPVGDVPLVLMPVHPQNDHEAALGLAHASSAKDGSFQMRGVRPGHRGKECIWYSEVRIPRSGTATLTMKIDRTPPCDEP